MTTQLTSQRIIDIGWGFMASKTLLTATELDLFSLLGDEALAGLQIAERLQLDREHVHDFLDALVALGFLARDGVNATGRYSNTLESSRFLDKKSPFYMGGILDMASRRLYRYWDDLPQALRSGQAQSEIKHGGTRLFEEMYQDEAKLTVFAQAMSGLSRDSFIALAGKFDFSPYTTLCDVGGSSGLLSLTVARSHADIQCTSFDLPPLEPIARKAIEKAGLTERITAKSGDFLEDPLPKADLITMGLILHDWGLEHKKQLLRKAYEALPENGALVVIENFIDDERRTNTFGLLMSLNMLIEFGGAFDYTFADLCSWGHEVGFSRFDKIPLTGPSSAAILYKAIF